MNQAVPVFVINLQRRPDRLARIGSRLDDIGIRWTRVDALDVQTATDADMAAVMRQGGPLGPMGTGDRVCTISHLRAWEAFLRTDAQFALFLEDDVYLADDSLGAVATASWIPANVDVVKLEKFGGGSSKILLGRAMGALPGGGRLLHRMYSRHVGGGAYILSRNAASQGLDLRGSISIPVDHLLFNVNISSLALRMRPVVVRPAMATQRHYDYDSDVDVTRKAVRLRGWRKLRSRLARALAEVRLLPWQVALVLSGQASLLPLTWSENGDPQPGSPLSEGIRNGKHA